MEEISGELTVRHGNTPLISLSAIGKRYPGVVALQDISLDIYGGTIHALLGENGAGKTTLVKVLTGAVAPDKGTLSLLGHICHSVTPKLARTLGIAVINQDSQIAPDLTLTENILLDRLPHTNGIVNWKQAHARARELLARVGLNMDPRLKARRLRPVEAKLMDIARALSMDARLLILDEPTAILGRQDSQRLFEFIRRQRSQGVAILYISHHLIEALGLADDLTILRDGKQIVTAPASEFTLDRVIRVMLGRDPEKRLAKGRMHTARNGHDRGAVLTVEGVRRAPSLRGVSFDVRAGETVCITGLSDSGRRELIRCVAGAEQPDRGVVRINGKSHSSPAAAIKNGLVFLPADRKHDALFLERNLLENIEVGPVAVSHKLLFHPRKSRESGRQLLSKLDVRASSPMVEIRKLSGGNQQKVLLARWLGLNAHVYVFDEPTEGIDIGAKLEIYALLGGLAASGAAVLISTSDYEEVQAVADRAIVLARGTISGELQSAQISEERLLELEAV